MTSSRPATLIPVALVTLVSGFAGGWIVRGSVGSEAEEVQQEDGGDAKRSSAFVGPRGGTGDPAGEAEPRGQMICYRRGEAPAEDVDAEAVEALRMGLGWCESRLAQSEHRGRFRRNEFPETAVSEQPEAWTAAVENAIEDCELPIEFELIDCEEYPCVGVFRPPADADPESDGLLGLGPYGRYRQDLKARLTECDALRRAFGLDAEAREDLVELVEIWPYDVPCEGGKEDILVLTVFDKDGTAAEVLREDGTSDATDDDILRWAYRRGEDVAAAWKCAE